MSTAKTGGNYIKLLPVRPEAATRKGKKSLKNLNDNYKVFCVSCKRNKVTNIAVRRQHQRKQDFIDFSTLSTFL